MLGMVNKEGLRREAAIAERLSCSVLAQWEARGKGALDIGARG